MTKPNKKQIETAKSVALIIIVTAALAFVAGAKYQSREHAQVQQAVSAATASK